MSFLRSSRGFATVGTVTAILAITVTLLIGTGSSRTLFDLGDGFAWLANDDGTAVLVNGENGEGTFRISLEGEDLEIIYRDGQAYIRVERDGQVLLFRLDDSTFLLDGGRQVDGRDILKGGERAYLVDYDSGDVQPIDPTSLESTEEPVSFTPPIETAIGSDGLLAVLETANSQAMVLEGSTTIASHSIGHPGDAVRAVTVGPMATSANLSGHQVVRFQDGEARRTGFSPPPGRLQVPVESEGRKLVILAIQDQASRFAIIDLDEGAARGVELETPVDESTDLYAAPRAVYLHDSDDDRVIVVDPDDGTTIESIDLARLGEGQRHLFLKDGLLWVNNVQGELALVINEVGRVREVNKYDPDIPQFDADDPGEGEVDEQEADEAGAPESNRGTPSSEPPPVADEPPPPIPGAPGTPIDFDGTPGNRSVRLSWTRPSDGGSPITGYRLTCTPDCGGQPTRDIGGSEQTAMVENLDNGTAYRFELRAVNAVGESPSAHTGPHTPTSDVPNPPTNVTAEADGEGGVIVHWDRPEAEGLDITGFIIVGESSENVFPSSVEIEVDSGTATRYQTDPSRAREVLGFHDGERGHWQFTVTTVADNERTNAAGIASDPSRPSAAVDPYQPPAFASAATLTGVASDATAELSWATPPTPALRGGRPLEYVICSVSCSTGDELWRGEAPPAVLSGLENGALYTFAVVAENTEGQRSDELVVSDLQPHRPPQIHSLSGHTVSQTQIRVTFGVNWYGTPSTNCWATPSAGTASGGCSEFVVGGLSAGNQYTVTVCARNPFDQEHCASVTARTADPPPIVSITKGSSVTASDCTHWSCAYIRVSASNFAPNRQVTIQCIGDGTVFFEYTRTTTSSGSLAAHNHCYYGFPGRAVSVRIDGVSSNTLIW